MARDKIGARKSAAVNPDIDGRLSGSDEHSLSGFYDTSAADELTPVGPGGGITSAISITDSAAYTQNFDTLGSTVGTDSVLPANWAFSETGGSAPTTYTVNNGANSNTADTYSYGLAGTNAVTDRAFGSLCSGTVSQVMIGAGFTNNTGGAISSLLISYFGEQYRNGGNTTAQKLDFQISFDATSLTTGSWSDINTLDFTGPIATATAGMLDGNATANRVSLSSSVAVNILNNATFWIRWIDVNDTGNDHGLAIDDFSMTATLNQAPTVANEIPDQHLDEDDTLSFQFAADAFNDPDGDTLTYTATLADDSPLPGWLTFTAATRTFSGTPPADFNGTISLKVTATDTHSSAVSDIFDLIVDPVNDAPVADIVPADFTATEQVPLDLKGSLTVSDVDADSGTVTATIVVNEGILHGTAGTTGASVSGDGTDTLTITGTLAQVQAFLSSGSDSSFTYVFDGDNPPADTTLTLTVDDGGNSGFGGALQSQDVATINITAVNDAPALNASGTGNPYTEDSGTPTQLFASAAATTVESDQNFVSLTMTVTNLSGNAAEILHAGSGQIALVDGSATIDGVLVSVSLAGSLGTVTFTLPGFDTAALAAWVESLAYSNDLDAQDGPSRLFTLTEIVDSGPGGGSPDVNTTALNIFSDVVIIGSQDDPTGTSNTIAITEDNSYVLTFADFGYSDADGDAMSGLYIVGNVITGGMLLLNGIPLDGNSNFVTKTQIDAGELVFVPTVDGFGTAYGSFSFQVRDSLGNLDQTYRSITFDISGTPDAALITGTDTGTVSEDGSTNATGTLVANDPDGDLGFQGSDQLGTYGAFELQSNGGWGYTLFNNAGNVQALAQGEQVFDVFHIQSADGTTHDVTITINGTNDDPTAADNIVTTLEDIGYVLTFADFGYADVDGDAMSGLYIVGNVITGGTLLLNGVPLDGNSNFVTKAQIDAGELVFVPTANGNGAGYGAFSFQVRDSNGGLDQAAPYHQITIDVAAQNDPATIGGVNSGDVTEDGTLTATGALTVTDPDSGENQVQAIAAGTAGANGFGTFEVLADGSWTYILNNGLPAVQALNSGQTLTDTILVTSQDGTDTETITVTIHGADESGAPNTPPDGADGSINFYEDALLVLDNPTYFGFSDGDGDNFGGVWIDSVSGSGVFTLSGTPITTPVFVSAALIASGALVFTPALNANGNNYAEFTFRVTDDGGTGGGGSDTDPTANTRIINILPVNDRPVIDLNDTGAGIDNVVSYTENDPSFQLAPGLTVVDVDSANFTTATVAITGGFQQGFDHLAYFGGNIESGNSFGVDFSYDGSTGVMTFTGIDSMSALQSIMRNLKFYSTSDTPGTSRTLTWTVSDGTATNSPAAVTTINITAVNDAPVNIVPGTQSATEDVARIFSSANGNAITVSDPDATSLTVTLTVSHGTLTLAGTAGLSFSAGDGSGDVTMTFSGTAVAINTALNGLSYLPSPDHNGPDSLVVQTSDNGSSGTGGTLTDSDSIIINVSAVNDTAVFGGLDGNSTFVENGPAVVIDANATLTDIELAAAGNYDGSTLWVQRAGGVAFAEDLFSFTGGVVTYLGSDVSGTITSTASGSLQTIATASRNGGAIFVLFNANATQADVNAVMQQLSYANSNDTPPASVSLAYVFADGNSGAQGSGGGTFAFGSATVNITAVNDAPVNTVGGTVTVNEDTSVALNGVSIADPDGVPADTYTVLLSVQHGTLTIRTDVAGGITGANIIGGGQGTNGLTITGTLAQINATLAAANGLTYQGDLNFNGSDALRVSTWEGVRTDAASFGAPLTSGALTNATSLITGDVNGDGKLDLVYIGDVAHQAGVRLGNGDGTFAATTSVAIGANPTEVILADIDGDNDLDLVSTDYAGGGSSFGSVGVNLNNGSGVFGAYQSLGAIQSPFDLRAADLNGDGRLDLVVARRDYGVVSVLIASGAPGSFAAPVNYSASSFNITTGVVLGDFNGDGRIDIGAINFGNAATGNPPGSVSVLLNNGSGTFGAFIETSTGTTRPLDGAVYDLNNDGNLDLVVASYAGVNGLTVMLGNGNGTFGAGTLYGTAGDGVNVSIGDVNGDGIADLVTGNGAAATVALFLGNGDGTFQSRIDLGIGSTTYAETTTLGDFNGDGLIDIAVNRGTNTGQAVLLNTGTGFGDTDTRAITVNPVNDAPTGTDVTRTCNEDATYTFSAADFGFADPDDGNANAFYSIIINAQPTNGTLTLAGIPVLAGQEVLVGDIPNLVFTPAPNASGTGYATFTFQVRDDGGSALGGVDIDQTPNSFTLNVTAVNDAPGGVDGSINFYEDANLVLNDVSYFGFSDPDGNNFAGVWIDSVSGNGSFTFNGNPVTTPVFVSAAQIAAGLLVFTPAPNANGNNYAEFTYRVTDDGGTANGGVDTDPVANTRIINVLPVNDAPVNSVPGAQSVAEDGTLVLSGASAIQVADVDASTLQVTLGATNGTLTLAGVGGLIFTVGDGTGDVTMTFSGTVAAINAALNGLSYAPAADYNGPAQISVTTSDLGATGLGGAQTDSDTIAVNVAAVNDAPVNSVPGSTQNVNEDGALVLNTGNGNAIQISDVDAGAGNVTVTLSVSHGVLTVAVVGGLSYVNNGTASVIISGSVADINTALGTALTYAPAANYNGPDAIQVAISDGGNTGSGGVLTDTDSVAINVVSINDAPAGTDTTVVGSEDDPFVFVASDFGFTDPSDSPANSLLAVKITTLPGVGTLFLDSDGPGGAAPVAVSAGQFISLADINAGHLYFLGAADGFGSPYASFTFQVQDNGGTANGGVDLDQSANVMTINLIPDNIAPIVDLDSGVGGVNHVTSFTEDGAAVGIGSGISIQDPDALFGDMVESAVITLTDAVAGDTLTILGSLPAGISATVTTPAGQIVITLSGTATQAAYQTALAQIRYATTSQDPDVGGTDLQRTVTVVVNDGQADSAVATTTVNIVAVDDLPVAQPDAFTITESGTIVGGNLFANNGAGADSDPDGPPLSISAVNGSAGNVGSQIVLGSGALLTVNADGTFSYDPNGVFLPTPTGGSGASNTPAHDGFSYTVAGGNTVSVVITLTGLDTDDLLLGTAGADVLIGGNGNDTYYVGNAADVVIETGGGGTDVVYTNVSYALAAGSSVETLSTTDTNGTAALSLTGNELGNIIYGNAGDNILNGGGGADYLKGYAGNDTYYVDTAGDVVDETAGGGTDVVYTSASYSLAAGSAVEILSTTDINGMAALALTGNELGNIIYGNAGDNVMIGGGGADYLKGYAGNDIYYVDNAGDVVDETAGGGTDVVYTNVSYALAAGSSVETLSTTDTNGTAALSLTGNELGNIIYGNAGDNILNGGAGADYLKGYGGNDTYYVDDAGDAVIEDAGGGNDTVYASASYTLTAGQEIEFLAAANFSATTALNFTGNEFANTIYGNDGNNILDGKGGSDLLVGQGGADTFAFTAALGPGNVDVVFGFEHGTDKIALDDAIFTAIGPLGALNANAFVTGSAAGDADDRIIYNNLTGALYYDVDGTGGAAAIQFATLQSGLSLTAGDFVVI